MSCSFAEVENFVLARGPPDFLDQRERGAAIAIGHALEGFARFRVERKPPALKGLGARKHFLDCIRIQRFEHQHARARQERRIQFE